MTAWHSHNDSATPAPAPSLTTEYTPRTRESATKPPAPQSTPGPQPPVSTTPAPAALGTAEQKPTDGVDASSLPIATAPPSHPQIDPDVPGTYDGRSILEVDLNGLADKGWRRPGSDISDWFNYGFDEISWEAYCYRRRDMGELANVLKANVLVRTSSTFHLVGQATDLSVHFCIRYFMSNKKLTVIHIELCGHV
jgi:pre-mRNA 3'-end-processing factor FIP1